MSEAGGKAGDGREGGPGGGAAPGGIAFQDQIPDNYCFGCGAENPRGLQIKSYWAGDGHSICRFTPAPEHAAGPKHILNGGIIATLIDCHAICTAVAHAYRLEGRSIESAPMIWYATGRLDVRYLAPTPLGPEVVIEARVGEVGERKTVVHATLAAPGVVGAEADVVAVRVPPEWRKASGHTLGR